LDLQVVNENNPESDGARLEEEGPVKKKQKGPSAEELSQDKLIADLQVQYHCEDRKCSFDYC
jgi:hypothetical protein